MTTRRLAGLVGTTIQRAEAVAPAAAARPIQAGAPTTGISSGAPNARQAGLFHLTPPATSLRPLRPQAGRIPVRLGLRGNPSPQAGPGVLTVRAISAGLSVRLGVPVGESFEIAQCNPLVPLRGTLSSTAYSSAKHIMSVSDGNKISVRYLCADSSGNANTEIMPESDENKISVCYLCADSSGNANAETMPESDGNKISVCYLCADSSGNANAEIMRESDGNKISVCYLCADSSGNANAEVCKYCNEAMLKSFEEINSKFDEVINKVDGIHGKIDQNIEECVKLRKEVDLLIMKHKGSGDWTSLMIKGKTFNWLSVGSAAWEAIKTFYK